jgi:hypothetical protein
MSGSLSDVLVMLAPYNSEKPSTTQFVSRLQAEGANVIKTQAKAEVSLTRCVLANEAYDVLRQASQLEWVFWLDQDISGEPGSVVLMKKISAWLDYEHQGMPPSVTGLYVNRYSYPYRMAAYSLKNLDPITLDGEASPVPDENLQAVPVLCGMGCLLQHRNVFRQHCDESQHFAFPNRDKIVPEVCSSHIIHSSELAKYVDLVSPEENIYYWQSEDFDYSCREWEHGRPVLALPFAFGHECSRILMPDESTVFPGLRAPSHAQAG